MAFQYTFAQQEIASCLVGTISSEALETNLGWLNAPINQELVEEIQAELAPIRNRIWVRMLPFLLLLPALLPWATTLLLLPPLLLLSLLLWLFVVLVQSEISLKSFCRISFVDLCLHSSVVWNAELVAESAGGKRE